MAPASGARARALVILLHGYASKGDDLIQLASIWKTGAPGAAFLAPNGPEPAREPPGTFQWWSAARGTVNRAERLRIARPIIDEFIDAQLQTHGLSESQLVLVGFSQGTTAALHVALGRERAIAGVIGFSGMLSDPDSLGAHIRSKPPVLLVHGAADTVVPPSRLEEARTALAPLGFDLTTHLSPGLGHSIDIGGTRAATKFLARVLPAAAAGG